MRHHKFSLLILLLHPNDGLMNIKPKHVAAILVTKLTYSTLVSKILIPSELYNPEACISYPEDGSTLFLRSRLQAVYIHRCINYRRRRDYRDQRKIKFHVIQSVFFVTSL